MTHGLKLDVAHIEQERESRMLVDLHSHATLSDGTLTIEAMVAAAEQRGCDAYAVTDHAVGGLNNHRDMAGAVRSEIDRLSRQTRMQLFAGVELADYHPDDLCPGGTRGARRRGTGHRGPRRVRIHEGGTGYEPGCRVLLGCGHSGTSRPPLRGRCRRGPAARRVHRVIGATGALSGKRSRLSGGASGRCTRRRRL